MEWTLTPSHFNNPNANEWVIYNSVDKSDVPGAMESLHYNLSGDYVDISEYSLRPAIALKGNVQITGSGTQYDPYVVQ